MNFEVWYTPNMEPNEMSPHGQKISAQATKRAILENIEAGTSRKPWSQVAKELGIKEANIEIADYTF
jgi:predicted nucleic acid-binding Zn ribbon protein